MGAVILEQTCVYKPKDLKRLSRNIFVVVGTTKAGFLKTSRCMVIVRHEGDQLTLINPIRLNDAGEDALTRLGRICRVIRLGPTLAGCVGDDEYYREVYGAEVLAPSKDTIPKEGVDQVITEDLLLPRIPTSRFFVFRNSKEPEAALLIGGLLITSEALQNQKHNRFVNIPARTVMKLEGYHETSVVIAPKWRRKMQSNKLLLRDDFERLLRLNFYQLVGASGVFVSSHAKEEAVRAVDVAYPIM